MSEFSVFNASPDEDIAFIFPDSIVIESFPFKALFGTLIFNVKFLISKSLVLPIPLLYDDSIYDVINELSQKTYFVSIGSSNGLGCLFNCFFAMLNYFILWFRIIF